MLDVYERWRSGSVGFIGWENSLAFGFVDEVANHLVDDLVCY